MRTGGDNRRARDPAILPDLEARLREALAAEPKVRWAYLFGSAGRREPFRDLDVAVMLAPTARGPLPIGRIVNRIHAITGGEIDVVDLESAAPALLGRIVREGRLLADREPEARSSWEIDANGRALDIEPWLEEFEHLRMRALRERAG